MMSELCFVTDARVESRSTCMRRRDATWLRQCGVAVCQPLRAASESVRNLLLQLHAADDDDDDDDDDGDGDTDNIGLGDTMPKYRNCDQIII